MLSGDVALRAGADLCAGAIHLPGLLQGRRADAGGAGRGRLAAHRWEASLRMFGCPWTHEHDLGGTYACSRILLLDWH